MSRIQVPTRDESPEGSHAALDMLKANMGMVPNVMAVLGLSANALNGTVALQQALAKTLPLRIRDHIALAVSQVNGCQYCLSVHTFVSGKFGKMTPEEIMTARSGRSNDPKEDAAVRFARQVIEQRGRVSDAELAAVREAGFSNAEIVEIVALVAQFSLTNFINNVFEPEIDFPVVPIELTELEAA